MHGDTIGTTLDERLTIIQNTLKAPKARKNSFANYAYRNQEDILEAVKPLLHEQGVTLVLSDAIELVGTRFYVKATATLKLGTDSVSVSAYAREPEEKKGSDASQITGAASSYARKYALNGLFLIDDTEDADATNDHGKAAPSSSKPAQPQAKKPAGSAPATIAPATKEKVEEITRLCDLTGTDRAKLFAHFTAKAETLTVQQADAMIASLNAKFEKIQAEKSATPAS